MRLQNKVAIVTGGSTGIGQAIVQRFAREGAAVAIDYVEGQQSGAEAIADQIRSSGGKAIAVQASIDQEADVQALVDATVKAFGRLDIYVNNAGIEHRVPFLETPLSLWEKVIAVNLTGAFLGCRIGAQQMVKQGDGGRLINISSVHEDLPMPTNSPYCASKGGLRMLMRTICDELAPHKITVNNIGPGAVDTPLDADIKAQPAVYQELLAEIPLGRMGQPDEIAGVAAFLASDEAAYVTGATYFIDGGLMRQAKSL